MRINLNVITSMLVILCLIVVVLAGCTQKVSNIIVTELNESSEEVKESVNASKEIVEDKKKILEENIKKYQEELLKRYYQNLTEDQKLPTINVYEGDTVKINLKSRDPDGDTVKYRFASPLNANGEWKTEPGDAGKYIVQINATDGELVTTKYVEINVINRPPVLRKIKDIVVKEGETISFKPDVIDPENQTLFVTYSGWMTQAEYTTTYDDAGVYTVTVTASDGNSKVSQDVKVTVIDVNRPPVLEPMDNITVEEGETIVLRPVVSDPENQTVTLKYSGWMDSDTYTTDYEDEGNYKVTITASDGNATSSIDVYITVLNKNRPPVFEIVTE